jgi:hypothetical protein
VVWPGPPSHLAVDPSRPSRPLATPRDPSRPLPRDPSLATPRDPSWCAVPPRDFDLETLLNLYRVDLDLALRRPTGQAPSRRRCMELRGWMPRHRAQCDPTPGSNGQTVGQSHSPKARKGGGVGQSAMAAAAGAGWELPWWVAAAALATSAEVVAATVCWLVLCRLAAWPRRRTRVAGDFPDPPTGGRKHGGRKQGYVKKGGHGGARPGSGPAKGTSPLQAQRGLAKKDEPKGRTNNPRGAKRMVRPIRLLVTVLLLPLHPPGLEWGVDQNTWNAQHILGPPTADGVFREPNRQPPAAQLAHGAHQVPGFYSAKVAWYEDRWASQGCQEAMRAGHACGRAMHMRATARGASPPLENSKWRWRLTPPRKLVEPPPMPHCMSAATILFGLLRLRAAPLRRCLFAVSFFPTLHSLPDDPPAEILRPAGSRPLKSCSTSRPPPPAFLAKLEVSLAIFLPPGFCCGWLDVACTTGKLPQLMGNTGKHR